MTHKYQDIADRYAGEPCKLYTLDGIFDATVSGHLHQYATIAALDGFGRIEVNWPTVERKMQGDKTFFAC